jgi:hypothetical protein
MKIPFYEMLVENYWHHHHYSCSCCCHHHHHHKISTVITRILHMHKVPDLDNTEY